MRPGLAAALVLLVPGCLSGGSGPDPGGLTGTGAPDPQVGLEPFIAGLDDPVFLTHAGDGSGRLFLVEQRGLVRVWDGALRPEPFLDVRELVAAGGERGLLGLAFHPDYAANGRFFVYYTAHGGDITIAQYRNPQPADGEADPATARVVLTQEHSRHANHNGGMLAFGPDGMLYAGLGDGGSSGDPDNNAQDLDSLLGKVIRIDVDNVAGTIPYTIPEGNPFAGRPGRDEVWAYGLRNPWRFSFDRGTGDLWVGDVGQNRWEEVDLERAGGGGGVNYGWSRREGAHAFDSSREALGAVDPVAEYGHDEGGGSHCSVTGGYVYRGPGHPALGGAYLFGDYCSGWLWTLREAGGGWSMSRPLRTGLNISSFGEDEDGELYVVDHGGEVRKVVASS